MINSLLPLQPRLGHSARSDSIQGHHNRKHKHPETFSSEPECQKYKRIDSSFFNQSNRICSLQGSCSLPPSKRVSSISISNDEPTNFHSWGTSPVFQSSEMCHDNKERQNIELFFFDSLRTRFPAPSQYIPVSKESRPSLEAPKPTNITLPYARSNHSRRRRLRHDTADDRFDDFYHDMSRLQAHRVELRREKSRLAAQIRRNREGQCLILLQNALPISSEVLGLSGTVAATNEETSNLLSVFKDDPDFEKIICDESDDLRLLSPLIPDDQLIGHSAVNLEKSDVIRMAGHTLFFLNHIHHHLGTSTITWLSLHSPSLHAIIVDPTDDRIVYISPAVVESIGENWASFGDDLLFYLHLATV